MNLGEFGGQGEGTLGQGPAGRGMNSDPAPGSPQGGHVLLSHRGFGPHTPILPVLLIPLALSPPLRRASSWLPSPQDWMCSLGRVSHARLPSSGPHAFINAACGGQRPSGSLAAWGQ